MSGTRSEISSFTCADHETRRTWDRIAPLGTTPRTQQGTSHSGIWPVGIGTVIPGKAVHRTVANSTGANSGIWYHCDLTRRMPTELGPDVRQGGLGAPISESRVNRLAFEG
jgi:hypothetical protein